MRISTEVHISDRNLSVAWAQAYWEANKQGVKEIVPLTVSASGFIDGQPEEIQDLRQALDSSLEKDNQGKCDTVANTIFPQSLWNPALRREALYERYLHISCKLKKHASNRFGLYFHRMIAFPDPKSDSGILNQLEFIISNHLEDPSRRRSALQLALYDPTYDHTRARRRGFPCLAHVAFAPYGEDALSVTGYYPTQLIYEKAYGNYLGLCRLGHFVATALDRRLTLMTCFTGIAYRAMHSRNSLSDLTTIVETVLKQTGY